MKKVIRVFNGKEYEDRQISYIPTRYILSILLAVLETVLTVAAMVLLIIYIPWLSYAEIAVQIVVAVVIIASDENPDYKLPWILAVLILPVVGFMLYFLFHRRRVSKKYVKRASAVWETSPEHDDTEEFRALKEKSPHAFSQARMLCLTSRTHLYREEEAVHFSSAEEAFPVLLGDLREAEKFIFMEYFILEEGIFWNSILEVLEEKAKAGVEVRVIYDDIGSMMTLPGNYAGILKKKGILCTPFSFLKPQATSEFNNRSHRKITVIDGRIVHTGGYNLADEYINAVEKYGHWKDSGLRLEGACAQEFTKILLYSYTTNVKEKNPDFMRYFSEETVSSAKKDGYLVPFTDGPEPFYPRRVGQSLIQNMFECAVESVTVTTPYLITDNELMTSIENAALRGVKVRIITPHVPDKKIIFAMTRSSYARLMKAGVEIYEYKPGFLHQKTVLADRKTALVGTINFDYRSLVHHFENGVWLYRCECLKQLEEDQENVLAESVRMEESMIRRGPLQRIFCTVLKIFAPLM